MAEPAMSVVMVDLCGEAGPSLSALRAQGPPDLLELVLVAPDPEAAAARYRELAEFGRVKLVRCSSAGTTSAAIATGVNAATCPVIAYCEEHAFPEPGWAQSRLDVHAAGAAAVGGMLRNANPATVVSWASLIQSFGPFVMPAAGGRAADLPWHQCSYLRDALPHGAALERMLENEGLLHADLRRAGHELRLEIGAVAAHLNPSRLGAAIVHAWIGGRAWGAARARHEGWSAGRRLLHALQSPRQALIQLRSRLRDVHRAVPHRRREVAVVLAAGIAVHAAGEATGVLFGEGRAVDRRAEFELNRRLQLTDEDRRQVGSMSRPLPRSA